MSGTIIINTGPSPSGKSIYGHAWKAEDPDNRIVMEEGQFYLTLALDRAREGYDVLLNISTDVKFGVHEMEEA